MDVQSPLSSFTKLSTVIFSVVISDCKMSLAFHVHHKSRPRALLPHTPHAVVYTVNGLSGCTCKHRAHAHSATLLVLYDYPPSLPHSQRNHWRTNAVPPPTLLHVEMED